jgi:hypothetical protein
VDTLTLHPPYIICHCVTTGEAFTAEYFYDVSTATMHFPEKVKLKTTCSVDETESASTTIAVIHNHR